MPEFATVTLEEAQSSTMSGRQGKYVQEYVGYIQQLPDGQAGKLHLVENETPTAIRKRLVLAAQALGIQLVIKRAGSDLYFWIEPPPAAEAKPKPRRGRRPRRQEQPIEPEQLGGAHGEAVADPDFIGAEMEAQRAPENEGKEQTYSP